MNHQENIEKLIDAYVDDSLDEEGARELLRYSDEDPTVLDTLHRHLTVNEMLKQSGRGLETMVPLAKFVADFNRARSDRYRLWFRAVAASLLGLGLFAALIWFQQQPSTTETIQASKPKRIPHQATVTGLSDPIWVQEPQTSDVGLTVTSNRYRLKSGKFAVQFSNDVQMAFSGLTNLLVVSPTLIECFSGKTSFNVSPQSVEKPFRVTIPQGTVVVTGTQFSVDSDRLISEVHVKEGSVRFEPSDRELAPVVIRAGQAISVSQTQQIRQFSLNEALYLSEEQMPVRPLHRLKEWQQLGARLDLDPYLMLRFDFVRKPMQNIANTSVLAATEIPHGKADRYRWIQGRFIGKWGVRLDSTREMISFKSNKNPDSVSTVLGIRLDQLPEQAQPLFTSGILQCSLTPEGRIDFRAATDQSSPALGRSAVVWDYELFGKWIMLAWVLDRNESLVALYVDGRIFEEITLKPKGPTTPDDKEKSFGTVQLGPFPGAIDEFMLFERKLSEEEIREIY